MRNLRTKSKKLSPEEIEEAIRKYEIEKNERIEAAIKAYARRKAARKYAEKTRKDRELRFKERNSGKNECELILNKNPQGLISVRCYCMSGFRFSKRYKNFDTIGVVKTENEAIELWESHVREVKGLQETEPFQPFPDACFIPCCPCKGSGDHS